MHVARKGGGRETVGVAGDTEAVVSITYAKSAAQAKSEAM